MSTKPATNDKCYKLLSARSKIINNHNINLEEVKGTGWNLHNSNKDATKVETAFWNTTE